MFGSKRREAKRRMMQELEEQRRQAEENAKREREFQARINVRKTLSSMKKQSQKLEAFKKDYIEKARKASLTGNTQTYQFAKSGLKLCLIKQRFLDTMVANFEISMQVSEMNKVISEFVQGINTLSEQMAGTTFIVDMSKAQEAYDRAIAENAGQFEALDIFLNTAADSIGALDDAGTEIGDDEIDKLISHQVLDSEDDLDKEIDGKINAIREKMKNE